MIYSISTGEFNAVAIRKRKITKITDLSLENVSTLSPEEILNLIENNMGTGWQGLPLAIQDIIESAFYVDVSLMPEYAMHRKGGIIERRINDGYAVHEIPRGNWIEGIFIKVKPKAEKIKFSYNGNSYKDEETDDIEEDEDDDNLEIDEKEDVTPNSDNDDEEDDIEEDEPSIEDIDVIDSTDDDEE